MFCRREILILACSVLFKAACIGQLREIDSLKQQLVFKKGVDLVNTLNHISFLYSFSTPLKIDRLVNKRESDSGRLYANQALDMSVRTNYKPGIAQAYFNLADIEGNNIFDLPLIEKYARLAEVYEDTDLYKTISMGKLSVALWGEGKFQESITTRERQVKIYTKYNRPDLLANSYRWTASVYLDWGYFEKSFRYLQKSMEYEKGRANEYFSIDEWNPDLMAQYYLITEQYDIALKFLEKATAQHFLDGMSGYHLYIKAFLGEKQFDSAYLYTNQWADSIKKYAQDEEVKRLSLRWPDEYLGAIFLGQKKYDLALEKLLSALALFQQSNDLNQIMWIVSRLTSCYLEMGNIAMAKKNADLLLQLADGTGARQYIRDANRLLWEISKKSKLENQGYVYQERYLAMKDTLVAEMSGQTLTYVKVVLESERARSQVQLLKKQRFFSNVVIVGIIILLLFALVAIRFGLLRRKHEKQRLLHDLEIQNLENEKRQAELLQKASQLEMQALRAQMNPHFIFNSLSSINSFILQNEPEHASEYLTTFSRLIRMILQNSQAQMITLSSELESLNLYLEIESMRFNNHFTYTISVAGELDAETTKVPPLILQPFVENAIWHGLMHKDEEGKLCIEVWREGDRLYFRIADNGIGRKKAADFSAKTVKKYKSMGLSITKNRIAMMQNKDGLSSSVTINDLVDDSGTIAGTEVIITMSAEYD